MYICEYSCSLFIFQVNGKSYKRFRENQSKILKTWVFPLDGEMMRVVLEKDTLDIWVNGERQESAVSILYIIDY